MCLGENLEGKRERIYLGKCFKTTFFFFFFLMKFGGLGVFIMVLWLFELPVTNGCRPLKVRRVGVDIIKV